MEAKASSKTLVANIVALVVLALQMFDVVPGVDWAAFEAIAIVVGNVILRAVTNEPVDLVAFLTQLGGLLKK